MSDGQWREDTGPIDVVDLDVVAASVRPEVRPTTFISSEALDQALGATVKLASETFQRTGSFKFRAALAVALNTPAQHLIASSSGNFGAALALAARRLGKKCTIVMPSQSSAVKIEAVRSHGATVDLVDTRTKPRLARIAELRVEHPDAQICSAFDDPFVIAGNATLGLEIFEGGIPDCLVAPLGGGGLVSGMVSARDHMARGCPVFGAEPLLANDGARSLRAGVLVRDTQEADTICDGARTLALGQRNFGILRRGLAGVVEVTEDHVASAVRMLFRLANLKVEPTGALAVAALLERPAEFAGKRVVCVVSGGNVDADLYARLISA